MIVEFFGPPGAGKTTLAHALAHRLRDEGLRGEVVFNDLHVHEPTRLDPIGLLPAIRRVTRAAVGMLLLPLHPLAGAGTFGLVIEMVRRLPPANFIWGVRLSQFLFRLAAEWPMREAGSEVAIFDQAFIQGVCSLALLSRRNDRPTLRSVLGLIPKGDLIVCVDASPEVLRGRLERRMKMQSPMQQLFEARTSTNLAALPVVKQVAELLTESGAAVAFVDSTDQGKVLHALETMTSLIRSRVRDAHPRLQLAHGECPETGAADFDILLKSRTAPQAFTVSQPCSGKPDVNEGESYRTSHTAPGYGQFYERTFTKGYYAIEWKEIEEPLVRSRRVRKLVKRS